MVTGDQTCCDLLVLKRFKTGDYKDTRTTVEALKEGAVNEKISRNLGRKSKGETKTNRKVFVRNRLEKKRKGRKRKEVLRSREEEGERINKGRERRNWSERLEQEKKR